MSTKKAMAAQYVEIPLEDMEKFLKRAFRVYRPKQGQAGGEFYYVLKIGKFVGVRVLTSVGVHSGTGAGAGADAIRVQLVSLKDHGPLDKGKAPIVKRTQGWRTNLQDLIEELIEKYDNKEEFYEPWAESRKVPRSESRPQRHDDQQPELHMDRPQEDEEEEAPPPPPLQRSIPLERLHGGITDSQLNYIGGLLRNVTHLLWQQLGLNEITGFDHIPTREQMRTVSKRQASQIIDTLLKAGHGKRYASEDAEDETLFVIR